MLNRPKFSHPERSLGVARLRFFVIAFALIFAGQTLALNSALAQEEPVELVFINSDPSDGTVVYDAITSVLELSGDLNLVDPDRFMSAGMDHSVRLETLRDGGKRAEFEDAFAQTLRAVDAEGLLILDVFGGGRTMQLVVIGPDGNELGDIRQRFRGNQPSQEETVGALKKVFQVLIPEIREFRERQDQSPVDVGLIGEDDPPIDEEALKAQVINEQEREHGELRQGVTPRAGMIFGSRSLDIQTLGSYQLTHSSPFVGFGVDVDAILTLFEQDSSALGATVFLGYAPFTTVLSDDEGEPTEMSSSFFNLRADLHYIKEFGDGLKARGTLGVETLSLSVEDNQTYSGNNYVNLRAGAGLIYEFGELAEFQLEALALPVLSADVSNNLLGDSDFAFGVDLGARLELVAFGPLRAAVGYHLKYYPVDYPNPESSQLAGEPAEASDSFHVAHLVVGYDF